ncbi:MAG: heavy-metal-associated domain-containing protein [Candidatus Altiarchaeota archaeon]
MDETKIRVNGMHCKSCEMLVKEDLKEIHGIIEATASHSDGTVRIRHNGPLDLGKVKSAITELGYKVVEDE